MKRNTSSLAAFLIVFVAFIVLTNGSFEKVGFVSASDNVVDEPTSVLNDQQDAETATEKAIAARKAAIDADRARKEADRKADEEAKNEAERIAAAREIAAEDAEIQKKIAQKLADKKAMEDEAAQLALVFEKGADPTTEPSAWSQSVLRKAGARGTLKIEGVSYSFRWIPAGMFTMGSLENEDGRNKDELIHEVELTHGFWMLETEVTQRMWTSIMGGNPSCKKVHYGYDTSKKRLVNEYEFGGQWSNGGMGPWVNSWGPFGKSHWVVDDSLAPKKEEEFPQSPVESVNWKDCHLFMKTLCRKARAEFPKGINFRFRLPTEAEWEYASRAGEYDNVYSGSNGPNEVAWYQENCEVTRDYLAHIFWQGDLPYPAEWREVKQEETRETHDVGKKEPNAWGLYDMSGNVWEWCQDWYGGYSSVKTTDPQGPANGSNRVIRGGGFESSGEYLRCAFRGNQTPTYSSSALGFRFIIELADQE